jgi:FkbM family methyltransferase
MTYFFIKLASLFLKENFLRKINSFINLARGLTFNENIKYEVDNIYKIYFDILEKGARKRNKGIIFDIGAHKGEYTDQLLKTFYNFHYFLFEPQKKLYLYLKKKYKKYPNIKIFNIALSDKDGKGYLHLNKNHTKWATLSNSQFKDFSKKEPVKIMKISSFLKKNLKNSDTINICKIDCEGYDFHVIKGIEKSINRFQIIQFEINDMTMSKRLFFLDFWKLIKLPKSSIYRMSPAGPINILKYNIYEEGYSPRNYIILNRIKNI